MAVGVRLFSGTIYEWMIHEFDPQFNYRATVELVERGPEEFRNWFDTTTWYPLGRVVGGTLYPGPRTRAPHTARGTPHRPRRRAPPVSGAGRVCGAGP